MIKELVNRYMENKDNLEKIFAQSHQVNYNEIVNNVFKLLKNNDSFNVDLKKLRQIDDGNYQGTLLYLIPEDCYRPEDYWYVRVDYGSCSGCDILEDIIDYDYASIPTKEQVKQYMQLALNIVQGIKVLE